MGGVQIMSKKAELKSEFKSGQYTKSSNKAEALKKISKGLSKAEKKKLNIK
jgi:hypothetical protein